MTRTSIATPIRHRSPTTLDQTPRRGAGSGWTTPEGVPMPRGRRFKGRLWILLLAALALALAALASPAHAAHGDRAWVTHQAHELTHAARHAHRLSEARLRYPDSAEERLLERFHYFEEEAERFERLANRRGDRYGVGRAFRRLTEDYWELRAAFRHFHGSHRIRSAFHRINEPMEALYEFYVGGNLYRDDPHVRHRHRVRPKHATPTPYDWDMDRRRPLTRDHRGEHGG